MALTLRVLCPDQNVFDGQADEVILPSTTGQLGVLPGHVSLLTALRYCFLISELLFSSFFLLLFIKNQLIPTSMSLLWRCLQLLAWFFFVRRTIGQAFGNLSIL